MSTAFGADRKGAELEQLCADTIRILSMDGVEKAGCGHPGMPMGMADVAHVLWSEFYTVDPKDPDWIGRDRFVLSAGHGSMLIYSLLHLAGFDLSMDDLKAFRQMGSKTPGHPEYGHTAGVETTTGPLGQGLSNGVGMALAERHLVARFPALASGLEHYTYVIASDGDLMEGVASEACSLAGHLRLSRLIVLYDDNDISIDGSTNLSFTEDRQKRFEAYGWHTLQVDGHDMAAVRAAIKQAQAETDRPTLISCKTVIGKGAPNKAGTSGVHGSKLGADELKATKEGLGWPQDAFLVPDAVAKRWGARQAEWATARAAWNEAWTKLGQQHADDQATVTQWFTGKVDLSSVAWPSFEAGSSIATRSSSGKVLNAIAAAVPNLIGGSADLTPSNKTYIDGSPDFAPGSYEGRNLRFGVREHGMAAMMNGIALHGGLIPYGGTFLIFTDYCRPSIRLSALMNVRAIYVMTHDSVFLGEDGPTHQPVEQLMSLRTIPGLHVIRPADAGETAEAWKMALEYDGPTVLSLTRQDLPTLDRSEMADAAETQKGGYVLWERGGSPALILMATGSEVPLALDVAKALHADDGLAVRVVSIPSWEVFEDQDEAYRAAVLPTDCTKRVSIEAGRTFGWERYTGLAGIRIGIDTFGASAPDHALAEMFGLSPGQVLSRVREYLR